MDSCRISRRANLRKTFRLTIDEVNQAPVFRNVQDRTLSNDLDFSLQLFAADLDRPTDGVTYELNSGPVGATLTPEGLLAWSPTPGQRSIDGRTVAFNVSATDDNGGRTTEFFSLELQGTGAEPVLTNLVDREFVVEQLFEFVVTASDNNTPRENLTFELLRAPVGATLDSQTGQFQWTPAESAGGLTFGIDVQVADDTGLSDTQTFRLTINEANPGSPVLTNLVDRESDEEQLFEFVVTATDSNTSSENLTFELLRSPVGSTLDPQSGLFQWTPAESAGGLTFGIDVQVTDDTGLSDTGTFRLTINEVNQAPVLTEISDQTVALGATITFVASAFDRDLPENSLTFSLIGDVPAGATIDPVSGQFTWTPSESDGRGPFNFTVQVTDDAPANPLTDIQTFSVTLLPVGDQPVIDLNGDDPGSSFAVAFTEDDGAIGVASTDLTVTNAQDMQVSSATVRIANLLDGALESLAANTAGTSITAEYDAATGTLALTGADSVANYQQVLRTVTYNNGSENPNTLDRTVEFVVNDGEVDSSVATAAVSVTGVNDAPDLALITDQTIELGQPLSVVVSASDPDGDGINLTLDRDDPNANIPADAAITDNGDGTATVAWTTIALGTFEFVIVAIDSDGASDTEAFTVEVAQAASVAIASLSPRIREDLVSLTRETVVQFDGEVDPETVTSDSFYLEANSERIEGQIRVSSTERFATFFYDEPLPASTQVRVVVDGDQIVGRDGEHLDADGNGTSGGILEYEFRTLPITLIPNTQVFGYLFDSFNQDSEGNDIPIVGATISLDSNPDINAVTDENGFFELGSQDLNNDGIADGLPSPNFFVHIDGNTATSGPDGTSYATLGKLFHSIPRERVQLAQDGEQFDVYLPTVALSDIVNLSADSDTDVGFGPAAQEQIRRIFSDDPETAQQIIENLNITYPAGSAQDQNGNLATRATIVPVDPSRLPAPLPFGLEPELVVSIQAGTDEGFNLAGGSTNFDVPAPFVFPNLSGLQPGEKSNIFSFNHDSGEFEISGTGTVSADGDSIVSNSGVGILAPGWHFEFPGSETGDTEPRCNPAMENCPPEFLRPRTGTVEVGETYSGQLYARDPNGDALFYFLVSGPENLEVLPSGQVIWIPDENQGDQSYTVTARVTDGEFFDDVSYTIIVNDSPNIYAYQFTTQFSTNFQVVLDVELPDRPTLNDAVFSLPASFGPSELLSGTIELTDEQAEFADEIAGNAELLYVNGQASISLGLNATPGNVRFTEGSRSVQVELPALELASYEVGFSVTGVLCTLLDSIGLGCPPNGISVGQGVGVSLSSLSPRLNNISSFTYLLDEPAARTETIGWRASSQISSEAELSGFVNFNLQRVSPQPQTLARVTVENESSVENESERIEFSSSDGFGTGTQAYYRFYLPDGGEVFGTSNPDGSFAELLPANTEFGVIVYEPSSNRSYVSTGTTSASGIRTAFDNQFEITGGPDSDGDNIPDIGELAIGTNIDSGDTDGDGISDAAELVQGLDPTDNLSVPTGLIASVPLEGSPYDLEVFSNLNDSPALIAAIASGEAGVSLVDASQFDAPIVLNQLELAGNAQGIAVDDLLQTAVVAAGNGGLHFVDVSFPSRPQLIRTVDGGYQHVDSRLGVAFASRGLTVDAFDIESGVLLGSVAIPSQGRVEDLEISGSTLYTFIGASDELVSVDVSSPAAMAILDELTVRVASSPTGIGFSSNALLLAGNGLITINNTDPSQLQLVSGTDSQFSARRVATNGSGVALIAGEGQGLGVYDIADPQDTDREITTLEGGVIQDVATSSGIAFTLDLQGRQLQVVNYLQFDTAGEAPTIVGGIDPANDVVSSTPGIQILEGTRLPISVIVEDDVQIRNVEVLVGGNVVQNAVAFPFELSAIAPILGENQTSQELQISVRAWDTGGNSTTVNLATVEVIQDVNAPEILEFRIRATDAVEEQAGLQLAELDKLEFQFDVNDQGRIALVELLEGGEVLETSGLETGGFRLQLEELPDDEMSQFRTYTLRATDSAGNSATSEPISFELVQDLTSPRFLTSSISDGTLISTGSIDIRLEFDEILGPVSENAFWLEGASGNVISTNVVAGQNPNILYVQFDIDEVGDYQFNLDSNSVVDLAGNSLEISSFSPISIELVAFDRGQFAFPISELNGIDREELVSGEFSGDGFLDIVVSFDNEIAIYAGNGGGLFTEHSRHAVGSVNRTPTVGDLNQDGLSDLVVVNGLSDDITILLQMQSGGFAEGITIDDAGRAPQRAEIFDINMDGVPDLAFPSDGFSSGGPTIRTYIGSGDGTFTEGEILAVGGQIVSSDFDQDGTEDLVVFRDGDAIFLRNTGSGFDIGTPFAVGQVQSVASADLNGDGFPDIAIATGEQIGISLLAGAGNGTFIQSFPFQDADEASFAINVRAFDANFDGIVDLIFETSSLFTFFLPDSTKAAFGDPFGGLEFPTVLFDAAGEIADVDSDQVFDLTTTVDRRETRGLVTINGRDNRIQSQETLSTDERPIASLSRIDLDADGLLDIIAMIATEDRFGNEIFDLDVFYGNPDGSFEQPITVEQNFAGGFRFSDLDGNGTVEIVVSSGTLYVLEAQDRQWTRNDIQRFISFLTTRTNSFSIGDINGDGLNDIAITTFTSFSGVTNTDFRIFMQESPLTFTEISTMNEFGLGSLFLEDFNEDGLADLLVAKSLFSSSSEEGSRVYLGDGSGNFTLESEVYPNLISGPFALDDVDQDGAVDFFKGFEPRSNEILLFPYLGNGQFSEPTRFDPGLDFIRTSRFADLNSDGILDVATLSFEGLSVVFGMVDGTFGSPDYYLLPGYTNVEFEDVDDDGDLDFILTDSDTFLTVENSFF